MKHIGRNDLCPCGSGEKYKKCCLASADAGDFQYRRWRQVEVGLIPRLTEFAFENFGPEIVEEAWKNFNDHESVGDFDPESPMNMVFMPWFLFGWIFKLKPTGSRKFIETTVAEQYLTHNRKEISTDEETLLLSASRCPFTLCEVVEFKPGVGITQFELPRIKYEVSERLASQTLKQGEIIYCATTELGGVRSNMATGPYSLRPTAKRDVLDLRKWIKAQIGSEEITTDHLQEFSYDIRGLYLHLLRAMLAPPRLANTDGDLMVPQKLHFEINSPDDAFHKLRTLAKGWNKDDLLKRAELMDGSVVKIELEWLGGKAEAREQFGGPVLLGLIKIDHERLVVEVNSNKRAGRIRKLIEKRLGKSVRYKTTLVEPIESQVQHAWRAAMAGNSESQKSSGFAGANLTLSADEERELRAMMEKAARKHWESWFDLSVPALDDMTPREAARTEEGRELLNSLLLLYEQSADDQSENLLKPDVAALPPRIGHGAKPAHRRLQPSPSRTRKLSLLEPMVLRG